MNPATIMQLVMNGIGALEPVVAELIAELEGKGQDASAHKDLADKLGQAKVAAQQASGS